jgi:hypothetical protein
MELSSSVNFDKAFARGLIFVQQYRQGAFVMKVGGDSTPDAVGAAGDQYDFVFQVKVHEWNWCD